MKITQTRLKQLIQEELAAVRETFGSKPPPPSASREEVNKVVAELFNVAANLEALGEDFHTDANTLDTWIGAFMEKHKVSKEGELEESWGEPLNKDLREPDLNKDLRKPDLNKDLKTKSGAGGSGRGGATHQATYAANPDRTYGGRGYEE